VPFERAAQMFHVCYCYLCSNYNSESLALTETPVRWHPIGDEDVENDDILF